MKALVIAGPWVLTVEEVSTPEPGPEGVMELEIDSLGSQRQQLINAQA